MRTKDNHYRVSRQRYFYSQCCAVEVSKGPDGMGPDAMCPYWEGESTQYEDPRKAVEFAIVLKAAWEKSEKERCVVDADALFILTHANPGIHGMEGEEYTELEMRAWAEAEYQALPKCDRCGEIRHETYHINDDYYSSDEAFCSENCAEIAYDFLVREELSINEELEAEQVANNARLEAALKEVRL